MRHWWFMIVVALALEGMAAPQPVRNPFWPVGHEGERTVISPVPRVRKAPVQEVAPDPKAAQSAVQEEEPPPTGEATVAEWEAACRQIKVGVVMRARKKGAEERSSVIFNGKVCNVGEEVVMPTRHRRFVWRFAGIGKGGVVRLVRLRTEQVAEQTIPKTVPRGLLDFFKNQVKD